MYKYLKIKSNLHWRGHRSQQGNPKAEKLYSTRPEPSILLGQSRVYFFKQLHASQNNA